MAEMIVLEATRRDVIGKQVKGLRAAGLIPGVLYGPAFDSIPLQVEWATLRPVLLQAGGSQVIEINVDGEPYNALVRGVQRSPLRGDVLHIDFYRVRMDVAIRTEVPITLVGDADVLEEAGGALTQEMTSIMVACLPTDLPHGIHVDVSGLKEVGDVLLVSDLPDLPGVTYMASGEDVVVTTSYLQRAAEGEAEEEEEEIFRDVAEPELIRRREEDENEV